MIMRTQPHHGAWLEVICGSMFSGKSEELMRRLTRAQIANQQVLIVKPSIDDRYHKTNVVSHAGRSLDALSVQDVRQLLTAVDSIKPDVVGIDEVQFFPPEIIGVISEIVDKGCRVVVSGLDQDFRGEPFAIIPELMARAEFIDKLQAICVKCGGVASRTQRLIDGAPAGWDSPIVVVGGQESYEARCRDCHRVANKP